MERLVRMVCWGELCELYKLYKLMNVFSGGRVFLLTERIPALSRPPNRIPPFSNIADPAVKILDIFREFGFRFDDIITSIPARDRYFLLEQQFPDQFPRSGERPNCINLDDLIDLAGRNRILMPPMRQ